ncbi:hypothetical protein P1X14_01580 [Sphingomonas sp. AOB5]|uniref:hypothetical protein n=1 Tax=Sphingomonas sp. AOB5 TaxID=3034017 RepID=UPI0023F9FD2E|nr:hypothetical protein [Sphingomonas sp. AOB5]MDF7773923.1 hypothetical protein [Sphingomonas sp. AOB5]
MPVTDFAPLRLYDASRANGHFSLLTLSIMEEASAREAWRGAGEYSKVGMQTQAERAEREAVTAGFNLDEMHQSLTSVHEHNHFAAHTGSAFGVLVTYVQLMRHALIVSMPRMGELETPRAILDLYDRVLFSLTGYSPEWTQADAVDALNMLFTQFTDCEAPFVADTPSAPACPDPRFAYTNLLEASALMVEMRQLRSFAPNLDPVPLLRYDKRDHLIYFALIDAMREQMGLLAPCQMALGIALSGPVPVFGTTSGVSGKLRWSAFHPGYRLAHLIPGSQRQLQTARDALTKNYEDPEMAEDRAYDSVILEMYLDIFKQTGLIGYCGGIRARETPLTASYLRERLTERGGRMLGKLGFHRHEPILQHACDSYNSVQAMLRKSFLAAGMTEMRFYGAEARDTFAEMVRDREIYYALFSIFAGEFRSEYASSKVEAVTYGLFTAMQAEIVDYLAQGYEMDTIRAYLDQKYHTGVETSDRLLASAISQACDSLTSVV